MITLGLDASFTRSGIAILEDGNLIHLCRIQTSTSLGIESERHILIAKAMQELISRFNIKQIAAEGVVFGEITTPALYATYITLQTVMLRNKCRVVYFAPAQWYKMLYCTSGFDKIDDMEDDIKKLEMEMRKVEFEAKDKSTTIDQAKEMTGVSKISSDEADAYFIARFGERFFKYVDGKLAYDQLEKDEKYVFYREHTFKRGIKKGTTIREGIFPAKNRLWFDFTEPRYSSINETPTIVDHKEFKK